jgi:hypothetical protein
MLELTGFFAIAIVFAGSMLLALFIGEALINLTIRAMHAGVVRADRASAQLSGKPQPGSAVAKQYLRAQRI